MVYAGHRPATSAAAAIRFMREVQALRQASSPHVVAMLGGGGVTDDGHHYPAIALLEGESMQSLLVREERLPASDVVSMVEQVAADLTAAHDRGIVHRDCALSGAAPFQVRDPAGAVYRVVHEQP